MAVIDFLAADGAANDSTTGLFHLDGTAAQPLPGSAWGPLATYDATAFATLSLSFLKPSAADLAAVSNATARVSGRVYQPDGTAVGDPIELLTTVPAPVQPAFGYLAKLDTLFAPGGAIGHFKNLRITGDIVSVLPTEPTIHDVTVVTGADGLTQLELAVSGKGGAEYYAQATFDLRQWLTVARVTLPADEATVTVPAYSDAGLAYYRLEVVPNQGNRPPAVAVTSPAPGTTVPVGGTINVVVEAADPDGQVASIELYVGATRVGTAPSSPASLPVSGLVRGTHQLTARAFDNTGAGSLSLPVRIEVTGQVTPPALATPVALPSAGDFQQFRFSVSGLSGSSYRVESSTNLVDWTVVETGPVSGASRDFTFPRAAGGNVLFYRVASVP